MNETSVVIADIRLGNLFNVVRACQFAGIHAEVTHDKQKILSANALILPGVGAFGDAMANMRALDLVSPVRDFVRSGKPVLGMCLGMQLLFSESEEFGFTKGLDLIGGTVRKFPSTTAIKKTVRVPQVGWNRIYPQQNWSNTILNETKPGDYMYFTHSYYCIPDDPAVTLTHTEYEGLDYCSAIKLNNLTAFQFHPERSGVEGLKIYAQWAKMMANG